MFRVRSKHAVAHMVQPIQLNIHSPHIERHFLATLSCDRHSVSCMNISNGSARVPPFLYCKLNQANMAVSDSV